MSVTIVFVIIEVGVVPKIDFIRLLCNHWWCSNANCQAMQIDREFSVVAQYPAGVSISVNFTGLSHDSVCSAATASSESLYCSFSAMYHNATPENKVRYRSNQITSSLHVAYLSITSVIWSWKLLPWNIFAKIKIFGVRGVSSVFMRRIFFEIGSPNWEKI